MCEFMLLIYKEHFFKEVLVLIKKNFWRKWGFEEMEIYEKENKRQWHASPCSLIGGEGGGSEYS